MIRTSLIVTIFIFFPFVEKLHSKLIISEFLANNEDSLLDEDGHPSDWIEIFNTSISPVSSEGYFLTDDEKSPNKWKLPNAIIPPNGYLVFFASGKDRINENNYSHANFSLSASGEYLALTFNGSPSSEFTPIYPDQYKNISYGFNTINGSEGYFSKSTPGEMNGPIDYSSKVSDTKFDIDRGFYQSPFNVKITTKTKGSTIIYTIDGSNPSLDNGTKVVSEDPQQQISATLYIDKTTTLRAAAYKQGLIPSNIDTQTYLFLDDIVTQAERPEGYPYPWVSRNGQSIEGDYGMDPNVVGKLYSLEEIKESLLDIPTVSIVTDKNNLFGTQSGIQVNPRDSGSSSEREISIEFINFENSENSQENAGIRMNGNASRLVSRPKHNLRVIFRDDYGKGTLNYPLFGPEAETNRFNSIILRGGNGNSWIHPSKNVYENAMYIRDQWFRDVHSSMGYPETLQKEVHVYFNGLYWGMHHLFERIEEEWCAERFGGDKQEWEGFRIVAGNQIEIINGTPEEVQKGIHDSWQSVINSAIDEDLDGVMKYLDINAFIDYLILNFQSGNSDWDQNNVRAMRRTSPPGKYMFFCHDSERAGFNVGSPNIAIDVTNKNTPKAPTSIHTALLNNADYKLLFADRVRLHLFNRGSLTAEKSSEIWQRRAEGIRIALKAESARWGDFRKEPPLNLEDWERALKREYEEWFPKRNPIVLDQLRLRGLYPDTESPNFSQHGGQVVSDYTLSIENPNDKGAIYYTTDGTDPHISVVSPNETVLVPENSPALVYLQSEDTGMNLSWTALDFDESSWQAVQTGIGFERIAGEFSEFINYSILQMRGTNASCLIRIAFTIPDQETLDQISTLTLNMKYDDGYAAFINGHFAAGKNNPDPLLWNSRATKSHPDDLAMEFEPVDITALIPKLTIGENVLAIQGMNTSRAGSDFLIVPKLSYGTRASNGISQNAIRYTAPVTLSSSGTVKARVLEDGVWSALNAARFIVGSPAKAGNLVISEVHYNPSGPSEENEFIELMNITDESIELAGVRFSTGVTYAFKDNDRLGPMERLVITPEDYEGQLDNGGERLTLIDAEGAIIESFRYNDKAPWFEAPDGDGPSLVRIAPQRQLDPELPTSWRPSADDNGNPGSSDTTPFNGGDLINYALGNNTDNVIQYSIIDDLENNTKSLLCTITRNIVADDAIISIQFSSDMKVWYDGKFLSDSLLSQQKSSISWKSNSIDIDSVKQNFARLKIEIR